MEHADCELVSAGFFGQPVNTLTTLGFVVAGLIVLRRRHLRWIGYALIATGIGSFVFHGPMPPASEWAHDVTLAWLILVIAGLGGPWERWTRLPGLAVLGIVIAWFPLVADPLAVALVVIGGVLHLVNVRSSTTVVALAALGGLAVFGRLGATGGPLCDPDSLLQPHGVWHLGAAAVVSWWVMSIEIGVRSPP